MGDDDVLTVTVERVPFGMLVYTPDLDTKRALLAAYHNAGWHLKSAQRRSKEGVFYGDEFVDEIIDLLACGDGGVDGFTSAAVASLVRDTYASNGSVTLGIPASVAMPLLGLRAWRSLVS
jgi:hypothetical protein